MVRRTPPTPQQAWMMKKRLISELENEEEFKLLDKLASQVDATTVGDAVQQVSNMTMAALAVHGADMHRGAGVVDYNISLALVELAQRLEPAKHPRLVEFVSKLQKQTATDPSTNEPLKIHGDTLWTDLPSFGYTELEEWSDFGGAHIDPRDPAMEPEQKQRFANLNAFIAQLTQAADVDYTSADNYHPMDKSLHAIWTMQHALEDSERDPAALLDSAALRAACFWFIYAADRLWENVKNGRTYPEQSGAEWKGRTAKYALEEGCEGWASGRWRIWEEGMAEAEAACGDEGMKGLIRDALANMRRVSRG